LPSRKEKRQKTKPEVQKLHQDDFAIFERECEGDDAFQEGQMMSLLVVTKG
jgi:hypothetical protein